MNGVQGDNLVILRPWSETICGPIALRHKSASFYFYIWPETTTFFRGKIGSLFPRDRASPEARHRDTRMPDKRSNEKTTTSFTGSRATDTSTSLGRDLIFSTDQRTNGTATRLQHFEGYRISF